MNKKKSKKKAASKRFQIYLVLISSILAALIMLAEHYLFEDKKTPDKPESGQAKDTVINDIGDSVKKEIPPINSQEIQKGIILKELSTIHKERIYDTIEIHSIPSNAYIYINDSIVGRTSKIIYIESKLTNIKIVKKGYITQLDIHDPLNKNNKTYLFKLKR